MVIVEKGIAGEVLDKPFLGTAFSLCCLITAIWWIIFTIPIYKSYEQLHFMPKPEKPILATFKRLGGLFKEFLQDATSEDEDDDINNEDE